MQLPLIDRFSRYVGRTICWLFLIAVIISVFEVVSDWVFDAPTIWVHDLTIILCSTCFLLGGAFAMQRQEHIRITVLYDLFGARAKRLVDIVSLTLALFYILLLTYFAITAAIESIGRIERSGRAWDFPMPMVIRTFFGLGCMLLTAQIAAHLWTLLRCRDLPPPVHSDITKAHDDGN